MYQIPQDHWSKRALVDPRWRLFMIPSRQEQKRSKMRWGWVLGGWMNLVSPLCWCSAQYYWCGTRLHWNIWTTTPSPPLCQQDCTRIITTPDGNISGKERTTWAPLVSKRPDFLGLFSYPLASYSLSAQGCKGWSQRTRRINTKDLQIEVGA